VTGGGGSGCFRGLRAGDARSAALRGLPVPLLPPCAGVCAGGASELCELTVCLHGHLACLLAAQHPAPHRIGQVRDCMDAVQGLLVRPPLGSSAADSALPACGAIPVLRFVTKLDVSRLAASFANRGSEARQTVAPRAQERSAREERPLGTAQRAAESAEPLAIASGKSAGVRAIETSLSGWATGANYSMYQSTRQLFELRLPLCRARHAASKLRRRLVPQLMLRSRTKPPTTTRPGMPAKQQVMMPSHSPIQILLRAGPQRHACSACRSPAFDPSVRPYYQ